MDALFCDVENETDSPRYIGLEKKNPCCNYREAVRKETGVNIVSFKISFVFPLRTGS